VRSAPGTLAPAAAGTPEPAPRPRPPGGIQPLDPRVISLDRITGSIVGAIFAGGHLVAIPVVWLVEPWPGWMTALFAASWIPVAAFFAWLALKWPAIDYRHWRYRVDGEGIEIWSGVVWRQRVLVPRSRVQHIDVSRGPLERSHGLATLSIHTAGTQHAKVDLRGLDEHVALAIRDALLPRDVEHAV
jgi:membrane protein YdbS with pleckstrin-like domain